MKNWVYALGGLLVGGFVSLFVSKKHYKKALDEEIAFNARQEILSLGIKEAKEQFEAQTTYPTEKPDISKYKDYSKKYVTESKEEPEAVESIAAPEPSKKKGGLKKSIKKPYVISPDDFGVSEEYGQLSFVYFADGTLADDAEIPMNKEDIERTVGQDAINHFGEYEQDTVYIRNEQTKTEYEILRDIRTYGQLLKEKPYLRNYGT